MRPIYEIAADIKADWKPRIAGPAFEYLDAMATLKNIHDTYGLDSAVEIVSRFLSLANTWRGEKARTIKAELNAMLKGAN